MGNGIAWPSNVIAFPGVSGQDLALARKGLPVVLERHARAIGDNLGPDMAGFLVVGIRDDGTYSIGYRGPKSISPMLFNSLMTEIVRREVVVTAEVNYLLKARHLVEDEE